MEFKIDIFSDRRWSYANAGTKRPVVKGIELTWNGALPSHEVKISPRVTLDFPLPEPVASVWEAKVPRTIDAKGAVASQVMSWDRIDLKLNYPLLGRLQEKVRGVVRVDVINADTGEILSTELQDLELLPPNEFREEGDYFEVIAAFVLPTDPFVAEILREARSLLDARTGSSSTQGYQADGRWDPEDPRPFLENSRAFAIAGAIYDAMSAVGYDYSNPQGYFDDGGQRVRTPSQIKQENCATCLDSAVLMAACFAQAGLEPVVFMIEGHAFAGYFTGKPVLLGGQVLAGTKAVRLWMRQIEKTGQSQLLRARDYGLIQQLLREQHIIPIETTTTTRSTPRSFLEACARQNGFSVTVDQVYGTDDSTLEGIVAVRLAWQSGITPPIVLNDQVSTPIGGELPLGVGDLNQFDDLETALALDETTMSAEERAIPPRVRQWMASLLDLSTRNPLLKIKPNQVMEFDVPPSIIGLLDDTLYTPKKRIRLPAFSSLPATWVHNGVNAAEFETWSAKEASLVFPSYNEINAIQRALEQFLRAVRSDPDHPNYDPDHKVSDAQWIQAMRGQKLANFDASLDKMAKKLVTKANDVMLNSGNNSLYLALGTIAWSESSDFRGKSKSTSYCAPLYLYPVILDGGKGRPWSLQLDPNGEVTPNFCLHEKLKRPPYNIDLQELVNPDDDDKGIDLDKMIANIRRRLTQAKLDNVAVQPRAVLGVFDYATFRLWKDLRDDWKKMAEISPVFKHVAYTANVPYAGNPPVPEKRLEPLLPIAADDSQREAVQLALDGQSYKLEGPPGTGKSQTITNLLASCIAHNLKVLFVAQKQTALNAVKSRLDAAGLGVFSLNLHSNGDSDTKLRKNISAALTSALNANIDPADTAWNDIEFRLSKEEAALDRYRASLHEARERGISAWNANEQLLEMGEGPHISIPAEFAERFADLWPTVREAAVAVEEALDLVPDPMGHPWRFVGVEHLTPDNLAVLTESLKKVLAASATLKQASGLGDVLSNMNEKSLEFIAKAIDLRRIGMLPDPAVLTSSGVGAQDSAAGKFRLAVDQFIDESRRVSALLALQTSVVDPAVFSREDIVDIRQSVERIDSEETQRILDSMKAEWSDIATQAASIPSAVDLQPLGSSVIEDVRKGIERVESPSDSADFNRIIAELRTLQSRAKEYESSVSLELVDRPDLVDIEFRLKEAAEAKAMFRGRKVRALREMLGPIAKASDDKLLINALTQLVKIARSIRDLAAEMAARFPEVPTGGHYFWKREDIDRLAGGLLAARVSDLRAAKHLPTNTLDDAGYVVALKVLLAISPLIEAALVRAAEVLPSAESRLFRPWIVGEFDRFHEELRSSQADEVLRIVGTDAKSEDSAKVLLALRTYFGASEQIAKLNQLLKTAIFPSYPGDFKGWDQPEVERIAQAAHTVLELAGKATASDLGAAEVIARQPGNDEIEAAFGNAASGWRKVKEIVPSFRTDDWLAGRPMLEAIAADWPSLVRDAGQNNNYLEFHRWQELQTALERVKALGLNAAIPDLLSLEITPNEFLTHVRRSALAQALRTRMEEENLDRFDRKVHERRIVAFEAAQAEARKLLNQRIPGLAASRRQARRLPSGEQRGATQDLLRGLSPKRGDKTPIRELISRYGNALAEVMPCFLMSPDSVAALLPVGSIAFDLVVFDEASQIRTSHAVGALGRGRAGIVVGDSRQMPPSITFSSNAGAYVEDDEESAPDVDQDESELEEDFLAPVAARDAESILSEFEESDLPQRQLLCHYRSKDEVLISFSNSFIYPEPMLTFPSTMGLQSTALRFVHVSDGRFERDKKAKSYDFGPGIPPVSALRTNIREAELIVDEVISRLRDPRRKARRENDPTHSAESIIIVTFNLPQMTLVGELFKSRDAALFERATTGQKLEDEQETLIPPQVKIRNLENVQGDEAETVIFSVAFSKTPEGKFPLNFGPVTRVGGERRLNVAVTRAQREMIVYASFLPEDMGAGGATLGEETRLLQQFLKLAHRGVSASGDVGIPVPRSRHIESVANELRELGFEVQTQLGLSTLRVDIALRRPGSQHWEVAVMVDDSCWANRGSAFQRELLPRQILPAMGWKRVYRIWLPSWKNSKHEIIEELKAFLSADLEQPVESPEPEPEPEQIESTDSGRSVDREPIVEDAATNLNAARQANTAPVSASTAASGFEVFTPFSGPTGSPEILTMGPSDPAARKQILAMIDAVLAAEAPIEVERLGKTVCRAFGFNRVTPARVDQIVGLVPKTQISKDSIGRFAWRVDSEWEGWKRYRTSVNGMVRSPEEIPVIEYGNALIDFVERAYSIDLEEAIKEIANAFGFRRLSAPTKSLLESTVREIVKSGSVVLEGNTLHPAARH